MKHRLFVSLDLPKEIIKEIESIQDQAKHGNFLVGNFTKKENIHLTLKFLGEVDEEKIEEIIKELSKIEFGKFKVSVGKLGFFSGRIFWVKLDGEEIFKLQEKIDRILGGIFSKEERFMSHITIVRVKKLEYGKMKRILPKIKYSKKEFEVKSFSLMESKFDRNGSEHERLKKFE